MHQLVWHITSFQPFLIWHVKIRVAGFPMHLSGNKMDLAGGSQNAIPMESGLQEQY
jgi:hypothetical protein